MQITLYRRSFPVIGAPVALSLVPFSADQRHTFTVEGKVYEAERGELRVSVPDDAKVDTFRNRLAWTGVSGPMKSTASEVYDFARAKVSGFRTLK